MLYRFSSSLYLMISMRSVDGTLRANWFFASKTIIRKLLIWMFRADNWYSSSLSANRGLILLCKTHRRLLLAICMASLCLDWWIIMITMGINFLTATGKILIWKSWWLPLIVKLFALNKWQFTLGPIIKAYTLCNSVILLESNSVNSPHLIHG